MVSAEAYLGFETAAEQAEETASVVQVPEVAVVVTRVALSAVAAGALEIDAVACWPEVAHEVETLAVRRLLGCPASRLVASAAEEHLAMDIQEAGKKPDRALVAAAAVASAARADCKRVGSEYTHSLAVEDVLVELG